VAENQKQQTTITGLVAAASGRGDEFSDFKERYRVLLSTVLYMFDID
jgi:hypothetical protein